MYSSSHVTSYMPSGFRFYPWLGTIESDHLIPYLEHGLLLSSQLSTTKSS
jgi:hypothetical protein